MIDTHVHILDPARFPYPPGSQGYVPKSGEQGSVAALKATLQQHGVEAAVLVAASVYGTDNRSLLAALAEEGDLFRAVVAFDPEDPAQLSRLARTQGVVGVRVNLRDDRRFGGDDQLGAMMARVAEAGLVLCYHGAPGALAAALETHPLDGLSVVIDHMGWPNSDGHLGALKALGARPGTWLKLSGGFRTDPDRFPQPSDAARAAARAFPSDRHLFGSDWPFIACPGARPSYAEALAYASELSAADLAANARALFWEAS